MSEEEDILNKMDALLKRHQPAAAAPNEIPMLSEVVAQPAAQTPTPFIDVPILTSVVEAGSPPASATEPMQAVPEEAMSFAEHSASGPEGQMQLSEAAVAQLMRTVEQHISQMLINNLAPQLISSLDRSVSAMMVQFNSHIEELVRDAITSELQKYLDNFVVDLIETTAKQASDTSNTSREGDSV